MIGYREVPIFSFKFHDELVLEVANDEVEPVCEQLTGLMADAAKLAVPLLVEAGVGDNWDEAH